MGLKSPSLHQNGVSKSLAGKRRNLSSNGGSPTLASVVAVPSTGSSRKLSQATLHKIFVIMMGAVFSLYVVLSVVLIRYHSTNKSVGGLTERTGKWGPSLESNDRILREHIVRLRNQAAAMHGASDATSQNAVEKLSMTNATIDEARSRIRTPKRSPVVDLEEVDIHEMKHPAEIKRGKQEGAAEIERDDRTSVAGNDKSGSSLFRSRILRAYMEPVYLEDWERKPLPVRNSTKDQLTVIDYPRVNSCRRLAELWPTDDFPDGDPFLPWIHDVFPTDDGRFVQIVAQNRRRCNTGTTPDQEEILEKMQPQIALFQHVPIQRIKTNTDASSTAETRYKLTSHEKADPDGVETRFICKFSNGQETLSQFNLNYDWAAKRKHNTQTFTKSGHKDNKSIHTSQLIFQCPVPEDLVEIVREGTSVVNDKATLFMSIVPIRTPPRYGRPDRFLPPRYQSPGNSMQNFSAQEEWGDSHILPLIEDSGRWENIPICQPTWKAFPHATQPPPTDTVAESPNSKSSILISTRGTKKNRVVACTWASTSYATRGDRFSIDDGARRLDEWIRFHLMVGFDHIFVYDNSHGNSTLAPVTEQFSDSDVTRIPWPATICNNNRNFMDSPGERSSQYAAESACRLRFGPHTDWMANMDIDEYIIPVGSYSSIESFLDILDKSNTKIVSFGSWRAWPRRDLIEPPTPIVNKTICDQPHPCFELKVPHNRSILQTYNCDRQIVKKEKMPAEKQIYRTDYVLQHYVHFSTVTLYTAMTKEETIAAGMKYGTAAPDPLSRFADEVTEVTMLHTKAIATQDTAGWQKRCKGELKGECRIGVPFPDLNISSTVSTDEEGWVYNCYVNPKIETYWAPRLDNALKKSTIIDFKVA